MPSLNHFRTLLFGMATLAVFPAHAACVTETSVITVKGEARLEVPATTVDIRASYLARETTSREALSSLERTFSPLLTDLKAFLPEIIGLQASTVSVRPQWRHLDGMRKIAYYQASRDLILSDVPVDRVGEWINSTLPQNL